MAGYPERRHDPLLVAKKAAWSWKRVLLALPKWEITPATDYDPIQLVS